MTTFTTHTLESAPEGAKAILQGAQKSLGFLPDLFAKLAESPTALKAYTSLSGIYEGSTLSPPEQQVVLLSASVFNRCEFCVAAHSFIAKNLAGLDAAVVDAIREQREIADARLRALASFTRNVVEHRGWVNDDDVQRFIDAGFTQAQVLEVVVGVSLKILSNYASHLTGATVNPELASEAWQKNAA